MTSKDEDQEIETKFSPGFTQKSTEDGKTFIFEQVENSQYVMGPKEFDFAEKAVFPANGITYVPLKKCPWGLATDFVEYESKEKLWDEVRKFIWDNVFLPEETLYDVLTSWVFCTWLHEIWPVVPYVFWYGPIASGKTRGLETLKAISYRGILSSNISGAALYRCIEEWHPTLFLDETEIYNKENKIEVVGILNSGYRRGQYAIRAKPTDKGVELEVFDVFGFKSLAGTQGMAAALESRSIMVRMIKSRRKVAKLVDEKRAKQLRGKLLKWRFDILPTREHSEHFEHFTADTPPMDWADGRLTELFTPLLAMANHGRANIEKYAKELNDIRTFEEKASVEAEIIEILSKEDMRDEKGIALTSDITEEFNRKRPEREKYKTQSVGYIIRELGFNKVHTGQGNGWLISADRLNYWGQIYGVKGALSEKVQSVHSIHDFSTTPDTPIAERAQTALLEAETVCVTRSAQVTEGEALCSSCTLHSTADCTPPEGCDWRMIVPTALYPKTCHGYKKKENQQ